jgi:hypothetical protein
MSATFKEFLREQAAKEAAQATKAKDVIDEWRAAVENLFRQMKTWLAESDPDGVIEVKERQHEVREPGLGRYEVPRLDLNAFGTWIGIIPKARKTVGSATPPRKTVPERATGRVDITDEVRRYVLYRFRDEDHDLWLIDDSRAEPKPLDQQAFEKALMSYLR